MHRLPLLSIVVYVATITLAEAEKPLFVSRRTSRPSILLHGGGGSNPNPYDANLNYAPIHMTDQNPSAGSYVFDNQQKGLQQSSTSMQQFHTATLRTGNDMRNPCFDLKSTQRKILQYLIQLYETSPELFSVSVASVIVFLLWQMPGFFGSMLQKHFVTSKYNVIQKGRIDTLLLSAVSHVSLLQLVVNLVVFLRLGPSLKTVLKSTNWPLWPMLIGAALTSSVFEVIFSRRYQDGALGLSGVVLSMVAMMARLFPSQEFQVCLMGVIPIQVTAQVMLGFLFLWTIVGSLLQRRGNTAYVLNLGGLIFGAIYCDFWKHKTGRRSLAGCCDAKNEANN